MARYSIIFLIVFLVLSSLAFAKNDENKLLVQIQNEFGHDLTHVPFFLRFSFQKEFNLKWTESYYYQRKAFLLEYERQLALQRENDKAAAKAAAQREKEYILARRSELKKEKDRLKEKLAEEKAIVTEYKDRQKDFNEVIKQQQRDLQQMEQELEDSK